MSKQVIWSYSARADFESILAYLYKEWNSNAVTRFIDKTEELIRQISRHPAQFPLINGSLGVRKCVISRQNTLFYPISENHVEIIRIFDSRLDPGKLKFQ